MHVYRLKPRFHECIRQKKSGQWDIRHAAGREGGQTFVLKVSTDGVV